MKKILTIIGARPQIIKGAALSREINTHFRDKINEVIVHTGQHYDQDMSGVFFAEMNIPEPDYNLNTGSGRHGGQTAKMIMGIEEILFKEKPDYLVLYGDTNSTLAGAIAASKMHVPVVHIEAGLRSFNKAMPEEINRIICDHVSTLLFSPTKTGIHNLRKEGFRIGQDPPFSPDHPGVFHCGDIMYDNSLFFSDVAEKRSNIISKLSLQPGNFILITIHRDFNTDNTQRLNRIFSAIYQIGDRFNENFVLPLHPRTLKQLDSKLDPGLLKNIRNSKHILITGPVSYLDMIQLEKNAKMIMTDSGGLQKEAYFFGKAVIILRPETEWVEIPENKTGIVTDADINNIVDAYVHFNNDDTKLSFPPLFGDGKAASFICKQLTVES